ncbi:esterase-like activity of phytase family protein [Nocardiopsis potens]|uniref:esterase-like activity of phytase family protein n=1 Tax=Nocardiopsis potens TaxID=1246458 RepID=UPI00034DCBC1|nr:esterase-like activity of phytase family protein [Nocardiopsis potens]
MSGQDRSEAEENSRPNGPGDRIDPARSACVLIGVGGYESLPPLPSVRRSVTDLKRALADPEIWGVPESRIKTVLDPASPGDLTGPIYETAELAEDALVVYYAGHGLLGWDEQLHLTPTSMISGRWETALEFRRLREILKESGRHARRRILILDCCFSGRALETGAMAAGDGARLPRPRQVEIDGSYVLTSTTGSAPSDAPPTETHTSFTGALIEVLNQGDPENPGAEGLSLDRIHQLVKKRLVAKGLPEPQGLDHNGVGDLPFVRNRKAFPPPPAPAGHSRRTVLAAAAVTGVLGLAAGAVGGFTAHDRIRADAGNTASIPGPCGGDGKAVILDVSDDLDRAPENEHMGSRVEGLSALALAGEGGAALALRDNEPAQVFSLSLGGPGSLEPSVTGLQMLYQENGDRFTKFDGEGLVLENGGETVLASSESGPAVRRFRIEDGRQVGDPLPLPEEFRYSPDGNAQSGRSLEALAATPDGAYLYAGMEGPILGDYDVHGRHQVRIQRYQGEPGGDYTLDRQFGYQTEVGLYLVELAAIDEDRLLALERGYLSGLGNGIRVFEIDLGGADDVTGEVLDWNATDLLVSKTLLFDMANCPEGDITSEETQPNQLLQNVEGMALGPELGRADADDPDLAGHRSLYLIADNNGRPAQSTRVYSFALDLR